MVSSARSRSRSFPGSASSGYTQKANYWRNGSILFSLGGVSEPPTSYDGGHEEIDDYISHSLPYEDHPLRLERRTGSAGYLSGTVVDPADPPNRGYQYSLNASGHTADGVGNLQSTRLPYLPAVDWSALTTKALSRVNASARPAVDVPLFLFEFREFPRMLRQLGDILSNMLNLPTHVLRSPEYHLAIQFGWKPLFRDLRSLLSLGDAISDRIEYLKSVRAQERVSGRLELFQDPRYSVEPVNLTSGWINFVVQAITKYDRRSWFVGRLKPRDLEELDRLLSLWRTGSHHARLSNLLGFSTLSAATIWNAIPWSWLIDYFSNVGEYISLRWGNTPFWLQDGLNLMAYSRFHDYSVVHPASQKFLKQGATYRPHSFVIERKQRKIVHDPRPSFYWKPFLTGSQMGILGALATATAIRRGLPQFARFG